MDGAKFKHYINSQRVPRAWAFDGMSCETNWHQAFYGLNFPLSQTEDCKHQASFYRNRCHISRLCELHL